MTQTMIQTALFLLPLARHRLSKAFKGAGWPFYTSSLMAVNVPEWTRR